VREDAIKLFGFLDRAALGVFEKLIAISGVGPKTALALLSGIDAPALATAVEQSDVQTLTHVPGIGKKTAERLCLELKGKLKHISAEDKTSTMAHTIDVELVSALESLGYKSARAEEVARSLAPSLQSGMGLEELVREALKRLQSKS
jgi:Holliday junction DNA helicase RuvA